ncbi:S8 family peptidase [Enterovibrio norvegicus]|uniref:S8 family peptidase n=1 Tax=Enterovibrio norvegicus TaxID=188144 RepID=UPI0013D20B4B|nr:S8 family serine peptidase [Enterovibrio norvegicus]
MCHLKFTPYRQAITLMACFLYLFLTSIANAQIEKWVSADAQSKVKVVNISGEPEDIDEEGNPLFPLYLVQISDHKFAPTKTKAGWVLEPFPELADVFNQFSVHSFKHAFPDSVTPALERTYTMQVPDVAMIEVLQKDYGKWFPMIERAPFIYPLYTPNDYYSSIMPVPKAYWHLDAINAQAAWAITKGSENVVIGIFEAVGTYFNTAHEDLEGQFYAITRSGGSNPHATAVSHMASGKTDNQIGLSSIGYNTKIFGTSWRVNTLSADFNHVLKMIKKGVRVINMSFYFGDSAGYPNYSATAHLWIAELHNAGAILIAGAGNTGGSQIYYPASYPNVLSVTSVGPNLSHLNSANTSHTHNFGVDLTAPGYTVPIANGGHYSYWGTGTSFAAPLVAGTAGLMLSVNPCLSSTDVASIIKSTTTPINQLYGNHVFSGKLGSGLLNAGAAVLAASNFGYSVNYEPPKLMTEFSSELYCDADLNQRLRVKGGENPIATMHQFNLYDQSSDQRLEIIYGSVQSPNDYDEGGPYSFDEILNINTDYYVKHGAWDRCQAWQESRVYHIKSTQTCAEQQNFGLTPRLDNSNNILDFEVTGNAFSPVDHYELKLHTHIGSQPPVRTVNVAGPIIPFTFNLSVPQYILNNVIRAELIIHFENGRTETVNWI